MPDDIFAELAKKSLGIKTPTSDVDVSDLLTKMKGGVLQTENSGNYQGPRNKRTGAVGGFQVLPDNIPSWTRKYYNKQLTPDEFERDTAAQDAVFDGEMGKYLRAARKRGVDDRTAIRMGAAQWYGGEGAIDRYDDPKRFRPNEASFQEYTNLVADRSLRGQSAKKQSNVDIFTAMAQQGMANPIPPQDDIFTTLAQQSVAPTEIDDPYAQIGATTQRVQPVTEKPETIEAQIQSANDPNVKTRFGVLATEPEQATLFASKAQFKPFKVNEDILWLNTAKIYKDKKLKLKNEKDLQQYLKNPKALTTLLGIAEDVGNETRGTAVRTKDPKTGTELATGVVTNPVSAVEQAKNYKDQFPNAEIEVTDTDVVTNERKKMASQVLDDPRQLGAEYGATPPQGTVAVPPPLVAPNVIANPKQATIAPKGQPKATQITVAPVSGKMPTTPELTEQDYQDYLTAYNLVDTEANRRVLTDLHKANKGFGKDVEVSAEVSTPQGQVSTQTPPKATPKGVEISFKYNPNDGRTYGEQEKDAMASQFAGQLGIDAKIVRDYITKKGFAEGNESESDREAQAKAGIPQRRKLDASAVADLVKLREYTVQKKAEIEKEAQKKLTQYTSELEEGMPTSVARLRTEFDMGGMSEDEFIKRIAEEKELAKNLRSQSFDANELDLSGITSARLGSSNTKVGKDVDLKENNKLIDSILERYPTLTAWKKEQDRLQKEYQYRPLAAPLEFAKGVYGAVPKAVASVLKSSDLAMNLNPLVMLKRAYEDGKPFQFKEGIVSDIGNSINKYVESTLNKDFDDSRAIRVISDTVGQALTQVAAGILSGGATVPTALGFTMGASSQFDEANKFKNATDEQKAIAWAVGGLAAVPDAVIFSKGGVGGALDYAKGLTKSLLARFGVQYGEKAAAEMTEIAMKSFAKRFMANAPKNAVFEAGQEVSENKINNAVAAITYDPSEKRFRDANPLHWTEEDTWSAIGGLVGGGSSAVIQAKVDSIPETEREDFIDALTAKVDTLVKQKSITPEQATRAKKEIVNLKPLVAEVPVEKVTEQPVEITEKKVEAKTKPKFSNKPLKEVVAEGKTEYGGVDDFFAEEVVDKPVEKAYTPEQGIDERSVKEFGVSAFPKNQTFTQAETGKSISGTVHQGARSVGETNWFSSHPDVAGSYGNTVYTADVKINNPFVVDAEGNPYSGIQKPAEMKDWATTDTVSTDLIVEWAKQNGYDGVVVKNVMEGNGSNFESNVVVPFQQEAVTHSTSRPVETYTMGGGKFRRLGKPVKTTIPTVKTPDPKAELKAQKAERASLAKLGYTLPVQSKLSAEEKAEIIDKGVRYQKPVKSKPTVPLIKDVATQGMQSLKKLDVGQHFVNATGDVLEKLDNQGNAKVVQSNVLTKDSIAEIASNAIVEPVEKPTITKGTTVYSKGGVKGTVESVDGNDLGVAWDNNELEVAPTTVDAVSTEKPKVKVASKAKSETVAASEGKEIRPNDPIYNESGKVGVYQEIEHNGKVLKRVQTVKGTPTISNTIEYKEGNWTKGKPDETMMQAAKSPDIIDSKGNIDYERAKDVARSIDREEATIRRLNPSGERGRIAGGQRAIEASVILAANERASEKSGSRIRPAERQEQALEDYAKREGNWTKGVPDETMLQAAKSPDEWYSALGKALEQKMPARASADQVRGIIKDAKQEEREWLGIDQYLDENPTVTKADILQFIRDNQVQVEEVMLGERYEPHPDAQPLIAELRELRLKPNKTSADSDRISDLLGQIGDIDPEYFTEKDSKEWTANPTKFSQYVLPGGENYKELLLVMPVTEKAPMSFEEYLKHQDWDDAFLDSSPTMRETARQRYDTYVRQKEWAGTPSLEGRTDIYKSSHFSEPNILVHIRFDDRTVDGKRVLHIAEIQSDWHQAGRKQGYKTTELPTGWTIQETTDGWHIKDETGLFRSHGTTRAAAIKMIDGVPNAPFKKSWQELAFKKILRHAVENGYDAVSWDTGETQAERYDLSKQVKFIQVLNRDIPNAQREVVIYPNDGEAITLQVNQDGKVVEGYKEFIGKSLDDVIGKEMAEKAMKADKRTNNFTGNDLKVGGEGMKGFYDKILPTFANKYVKKWGGKVEASSVEGEHDASGNEPFESRDKALTVLNRGGEIYGIRQGQEELLSSAKELNEAESEDGQFDSFVLGDKQPSTPVHSLTITPAMRESVMKGQQMFRAVSELDAMQYAFQNAKTLATKTLVEKSNFTKNARIAEGGVIAIDQIPEIELIRRIMGEGTQFYGVMADPNKVAKFNETLDKMIAHSDSPNLKRLKRLVTTALKHDGTVIFAMSEETVPEEKAHRALYGNRQNDRASQIAPEVQKSIAESDVFKNATKFQKAYNSFSEAGKVEEFAVKASLGQWNDLGITSEADKFEAMRQARNFYRSYAETNKGEGTSDDVINRLSTEIAYAQEYQNQEVRSDEKETQSTDEGGVVESARRTSDKADAETIESKSNDGRQASGENKDDLNIRRYSESLRDAGFVDAPLVPYIPGTDAQKAEETNRIIETSDPMMHDAEKMFYAKGTDPKLKGVLGTALIDHLGSLGEIDRMLKVATDTVEYIGTAAQVLQAAKLVAKYDFASGLMMAQKAANKAGRDLTAKEVDKIKAKLEKVAITTENQATLEYVVAELKAAIEAKDIEIANRDKALEEEKIHREATDAELARIQKQLAHKKPQTTREKLKETRQARIEAIRAQFSDTPMMAIATEMSPELKQNLIDEATLDIFDGKTPEQMVAKLKDLTNNSLSDAEIADIHLKAWDATGYKTKPTTLNELTAEDKEARLALRERAKARRQHITAVNKLKGERKQSNYEIEVIEYGQANGYTEGEIAGALYIPQVKGENAVEQWKKKIAGKYGEVNFQRAHHLRRVANANIKATQLEARREREQYKGELKAFENDLSRGRNASLAAKSEFDRYAKKVGRNWVKKVAFGVTEGIAATKGLSTWGEISYVLRQGFVPLLTDTRNAVKGDWQGIGHGLQGDNVLFQKLAKGAGMDEIAQYLSDHNVSMFIDRVRQHPSFGDAQRHGIRFTQIGDFNIADDHFSVKALEVIPLYKRTEYAYTLPGDLQRLYMFDAWSKVIDGQVLDAIQTKRAKKYAAETINAFTGKGDVKRILASNGAFAKLLNLTFFSPQLLISRFQTVNRLTTGFATAPKGMKWQMAKKGMRFYGVVGLVALLTGMVLDPDDDDFGTIQIKVGDRDMRDTRLNILAGLDVPTQLYMRTAMGFAKSLVSGEKGYIGDAMQANLTDFVLDKRQTPRFARSKMSPGASFMYDWIDGKDFIGRPTTLWGSATSRVAPLSWQQAYDAFLYDRYKEMVKEPRDFQYGVEKAVTHDQKYVNALVTIAASFLGTGITQYPKDDPSQALQLARQLSPSVSKKDEETLRLEGGLRSLLKAQITEQGAEQEKAKAAVQRWLQKYPSLRAEMGKLMTQAKNKTGMLAYYGKDLNVDQLKRVRGKATDADEIKLIDSMIKRAEKLKK